MSKNIGLAVFLLATSLSIAEVSAQTLYDYEVSYTLGTVFETSELTVSFRVDTDTDEVTNFMMSVGKGLLPFAPPLTSSTKTTDMGTIDFEHDGYSYQIYCAGDGYVGEKRTNLKTGKVATSRPRSSSTFTKNYYYKIRKQTK